MTKYKIAIFCDGEFFHGKDWEVLKPRLEKSNNSDFGLVKFQEIENMMMKLIKTIIYGMDCNTFWGKDIKNNTSECVNVVEEVIFDMEIGASKE